MAEKKNLIVIKKVYINAAGAHGGSWKVALADFMTALMCFFLVMWLVNQTDEVKKNVADYFSTPSIVEYNFSNYGVELTLEKLFLDLINEPLKFFQSFVKPTDYTPNFMGMGSKKIVLYTIAEKFGDMAQEVQVDNNEISFEIPDQYLFEQGTANQGPQFVEVMEDVRGLTAGLEDSEVYIDSVLYNQSVPSGLKEKAQNVAEKRLDLVAARVQAGLEHESVDIYNRVDVSSSPAKGRPPGRFRFRLKQKSELNDGGVKPRKLQSVFGEKERNMGVYDNFVNQLSHRPKAKGNPTKQ